MLGEALNLGGVSRQVGRREDVPIERLETGTLLHSGMKLHDVDPEEDEQWMQTTDAVDRGEEDDGAARVAEEEVIEVNVLLLEHALDLAFLQRLDESSIGRKIDELGISVAEVELEQQVICQRVSAHSQIRPGVPRLDMPSSAGPGLYLRCRFLRLRCRSLLIVAEKTMVRMSSRGGSASTTE